MNREFWSGRRVLVTGHTGFKGSWLSLWLQELGAVVTGYSLPPPTTPSLFDEASVGQGMTTIEGNICDLARLDEAFAETRPEIVFHLAAQAIVLRGYSDPLETIASNVNGTVHVLEASRHTPSVRAAVIVTSDKCYENRERLEPYREDDPLGGRDPYSASKACAEILTSAWRHSFIESSTTIASARAGNVIGGGDWATHRLVPDALRAWQSGVPLQIRSPEAVRPWQHVLQPLEGYLLLAESLYYGDGSEAWNFGPNEGSAITVAELLRRMADAWGSGAHWSADDSARVHEAKYLALDSSKARTRLGWSPQENIDQAIRLTVDWHKAWMRKEDMRACCRAQINDHMNLAGQ